MSVTQFMRGTRRTRRGFLSEVAGMGALLLTAAGCAAGTEVVVTQTVTPGVGPTSRNVTVPPSAEAQPTPTSAATSSARLVASPKFGSTDVAPLAPVTITAFNATITDLIVSDTTGKTMQGEIDPNGTTWTLTERLSYGQVYTFAGAAADPSGAVIPIEGQLSTVNPSTTLPATFVIDEGGTFGVGQPIVILFEGPVTNRAEAEKTLKVTTDKGDIVGSWGWLQDEDTQGDGVLRSQVHWRPKEYWPAYTNVTVEANLYGVDYGGGQWGREDVTRRFTIGRQLITTAEVSSFRLKVAVDGQQVRDYPVSYGMVTDPERQTRSGIHLVQGKYPEFDMCNPRFNYCGVKATWAVRINNNGEFIHENDSTIASQGIANVSHGCVNMSTANAKDFYDLCMLGDPVLVSGTDVPMTAADYIYDWTYSYDTWKTLSAL